MRPAERQLRSIVTKKDTRESSVSHLHITESQLRRIIREELLQEAAMTPVDARNRSIRFEMSRSRDKVKITALKEDEEDIEVGYIAANLIPHESSRIWEIVHARAHLRGLGPLLYDLMLDAVSPDPLTADRSTVSSDAKGVWDYYLNNRYDVESQQLDDLYNTLTPTDEDNYSQRSATRWSGESWPESSLSKAYRKRGSRTPTLDTLQGLGIIGVIDKRSRP